MVTAGFQERAGSPAIPWRPQLTGNSFPAGVRVARVFVMGRRRALYVSDSGGPLTTPFVPGRTWLLVERAPHTPICRSLIGSTGAFGDPITSG